MLLLLKMAGFYQQFFKFKKKNSDSFTVTANTAREIFKVLLFKAISDMPSEQTFLSLADDIIKFFRFFFLVLLLLQEATNM